MLPLWIKIFSSFLEMDVERYPAQENRDYTPTMLPVPPAFLPLSSDAATRFFESVSRTSACPGAANIRDGPNSDRAEDLSGGGGSTQSEGSPRAGGHGRGLERVRQSGSKRYKIIDTVHFRRRSTGFPQDSLSRYCCRSRRRL
jgi:hypothetical protein